MGVIIHNTKENSFHVGENIEDAFFQFVEWAINLNTGVISFKVPGFKKHSLHSYPAFRLDSNLTKDDFSYEEALVDARKSIVNKLQDYGIFEIYRKYE